MCTVTWLHHSDGFELFCNRDEKKARPAAFAPTQQHRAGVRFLAPIDPQSGGTWIAVNQFGVAVCLLNRYPPHGSLTAPAHAIVSRGLIPLELIGAASPSECLLKLEHLLLPRFAPFTLIILQPGSSGAIAAWDGVRLAISTSPGRLRPLTSSSFDPRGVSKARRQGYFRRLRRAAHRVDPALLTCFHCSCGEPHDAYSSCMHRTDAETVSFSRVIVRPQHGIRFLYSPGPPCQSTGTQDLTLPFEPARNR